MALTLKNVNTASASAGTEATLAGANLFNRAMDRITGGAKKLIEGERAITKGASADVTQGLMQGLDTATTENVGDIRTMTQEAIKDPSLTRADKSKLLSKLNTLDIDIGTRETQAINLAETRRQQADVAALRGIDRTGFQAVSGGSVDDFRNKLTSIKNKVSGIKDPTRRAAAEDQLRNAAGLSKEEFANRVFESAKRDEKGLVDQTAFAKQLREGAGTDLRYSTAEIQGFIKGREDLSGATVARAEAKHQKRRQEKITDAVRLQELKTVPDQDAAIKLINTVDTLVEPGFWTVNDKDQFKGTATKALESGVKFNIIADLIGKYSNSSLFSNADPEAFEDAINVEILKAVRNR